MLVGGPTGRTLSPNSGFEMSPTGWSKFAWLSALNACAPNTNRTRSVILTSFDNARSISKKCGPRKLLRPTFPKPVSVPAGTKEAAEKHGVFTAFVQFVLAGAICVAYTVAGVIGVP